MDDHKFDDIIKGKVGDYEAPGFDPAALSALHHQMATLTIWPWYSRYRTELFVSSGLFLSTLIILWSQWSFSSRETQAFEKNDLLLKTQQEQIAKLQLEVDNLKSLTPDTMRIIEIKEQTSPLNSHYLQRIKTLEYTIQKMKEANLTSVTVEDQAPRASMDSSMSPGWMSATDADFQAAPFTTRLVPREKSNESIHAQPEIGTIPDGVSSHQLSVKTMRNLEKHYRNGIGIRLGPALEISKGFYDVGSGKFDVLFGVLGDFILSPSLSVETGAKYTRRIYEISDKEALLDMSLPNVNPTLGPLVNADIDSWILEVPINLKYRYPLSMKAHLLAGIGYSSLMYMKQVFEYSYELDSDPSAQINTTYKTEKFALNPGMVNISLGLSKELKNKKIVETSLYYQHGLGALGTEKVKANFLGIRSTYWFTIK